MILAMRVMHLIQAGMTQNYTQYKVKIAESKLLERLYREAAHNIKGKGAKT